MKTCPFQNIAAAPPARAERGALTAPPRQGQRHFARRAQAVFAALLIGALPAAHADLTVIHTFSGPDGLYPASRLLQGVDGRFYGTTVSGPRVYGTVYAVATDGTFSKLMAFSGINGAPPANLETALVQLADGALLGTTSDSLGYGSIFDLTLGGAITTVYQFPGDLSASVPGTLADGGDGSFYASTYYGGSTGVGGTLFRSSTSGAVTSLHSFDYATEGGSPGSDLTLGSDGYLYGTLTFGPGQQTPGGALFRATTSGSVTILHVFTDADGSEPTGTVVMPGDGYIYGVTMTGGAADKGTVYKIDASGQLTTLHAFDGNDGQAPIGGLTLGPDGNLYGVTAGHVNGDPGTIYRMSPAGDYMTLHMFTPAENGNPQAAPIFGADHLLYGTNYYPAGVVFSLDALNQQPAAVNLATSCLNRSGVCATPYLVGENFTLAWRTQNIGRCVASGSWKGSQPTAGQVSLTITHPGDFKYVLTCSGPGGTSSATATLSVK